VIYRQPQQKRSQESLERILDAAEYLIRERGFDNMTVAEVVQRSESSVGSLYARFRNKLGLLQAVQARYHERVEGAIADAFDEARDECLEDAVQRVVRVLCDHLLNEPELFRAFILEAVDDARVRAQGERINATRRKNLTEVLLAHRGEINHPDPELAVRWFYTVCMAVLRERITYGEGADLSGAFLDETLVRELTRTMTCYLMCEIPTRHIS
jgi:AcrR family transcriptional regulator